MDILFVLPTMEQHNLDNYAFIVSFIYIDCGNRGSTGYLPCYIARMRSVPAHH